MSTTPIIYILCFFVIYLKISNCITSATISFPSDFKFGLATASYQIEGGWNANGKGANIWDTFTHQHPELILDHSTGNIACDSYHQWRRDVALLKSIGVDFYRFSLSWSRILPQGSSNYINPDGVRYYNDLINTLLENNIEPMVTLYHWDLPQLLQDLGGWTNGIIARYFEDFAFVCFTLFGDRVKTWITVNEPPSFCEDTYGSGNGAPGILSPGIGDYLCGRTVLLAHARVYHLYDHVFRKTQKGKVGITIDGRWSEPKTNSSEDITAAERSLQMDFGWWTHPIFSKTGDYPEIMKSRIKNISLHENYKYSRLPTFSQQEITFIQGTYDFLGLNHYSTSLISNQEFPIDYPTSHWKDVGVASEADPTWRNSSASWLKVVPWGFRKLLKWVKDEYDNPLVLVTENGYADDGRLNDLDRIYYHKEYLKELLNAIHLDGCNVKAYTAWSLLDNMEWTDGYTLKFGMCHVDFNSPNRTRTEKESAGFYRKVISSRVVPS